eukprot:12414743-Karenia_brevis.AAC.1
MLNHVEPRHSRSMVPSLNNHRSVTMMTGLKITSGIERYHVQWRLIKTGQHTSIMFGGMKASWID